MQITTDKMDTSNKPLFLYEQHGKRTTFRCSFLIQFFVELFQKGWFFYVFQII